MRISDWSSDVCSSDLFDQRQYDQNRRRVEGPFADRLGEAAKALQQGKDALMHLALTGPSRRLLQPAEADQPSRYLPPAPVDDGHHQGADSQPFVQSIGLVQTVEESLERSEERGVGNDCVSPCAMRW